MQIFKVFFPGHVTESKTNYSNLKILSDH